MNYEIEATDNFTKELKPLIKKYRSLKTDLLVLNESLTLKPAQGVPLGQGVIKLGYKFLQREKEKAEVQE